MQGCQTSDIFRFKVRLHAENVVQSHFWPCVACPVQRSAVLWVFDIYIQTFSPKVIKTQWLVFLSCHMQNTYSEIVSYIDVCSRFFNKKGHHGVVSILCYEMQSCKVIGIRCIYPLFKQNILLLLHRNRFLIFSLSFQLSWNIFK